MRSSAARPLFRVPNARHRQQRKTQAGQGHRRTYAAHAPVLRRQGGAPGRAAVLPHGRLLRAVLRRRAQGRAPARHHADPARRLRGPAHPDGGRAGACVRGLPRAPGRAGRIGGDLRADRRSRRVEGPGRTQGRAHRHAGHGHRRSLARRNAATRCCSRVARDKRGYGLAWMDLSSGRFLVNEVDGDDALDAEIARLEPAEVLVRRRRRPGPLRCMARTRRAPPRAVVVRCRQRPPPAAAILRPARPHRLRHRGHAAARSPPPAPCSATSRKRRSSDCRTCRAIALEASDERDRDERGHAPPSRTRYARRRRRAHHPARRARLDDHADGRPPAAPLAASSAARPTRRSASATTRSPTLDRSARR